MNSDFSLQIRFFSAEQLNLARIFWIFYNPVYKFFKNILFLVKYFFWLFNIKIGKVINHKTLDHKLNKNLYFINIILLTTILDDAKLLNIVKLNQKF